MSKDFDEMMKTYTERYSKICIDNNQIDASLFDEFGVKRGLRDKNGKGVLSGITNISLIKSSTEKDGKTIPCDGQLYYRGYNIFDLTQGFRNEKRFGLRKPPICFCLENCQQKTSLRNLRQFLQRTADCRRTLCVMLL